MFLYAYQERPGGVPQVSQRSGHCANLDAAVSLGKIKEDQELSRQLLYGDN
jgi:hypothetical protein